MPKYKLVEAGTEQAKYDLLCDEEAILKKKSSEEIYQYLYSVLKPGDTLQEYHAGRFDFPILSYEEILKLKEKADKFDSDN